MDPGKPMEHEITHLLVQARAGAPKRLSAVFESLYPELRRLAAARLGAGERTLSPTVLVHELYLRATTGEPLSTVDHRHFFAAAAKAMHWIVVDHARRRASQKRGGGQVAVTLTASLAVGDAPEPRVLALHEGLEALGQINPQRREVVELHYFAGLEFAQIAELLDCSLRTVHREWERARAFLHAQLREP
jgi:RNA polymerase sigma factor (TIGR02999 family)